MLRLVCITAAVGAALEVALASGVSPVPPAEAGQPRVVSRKVGLYAEMRKADTDEPIWAMQRVPLYESFPAGVTVETQLNPQPEGADVVYTVRNVTASRKTMGRLRVGILNLGQEVDWYKFRIGTEKLRGRSATHVGQSFLYPHDLYAPVQVVANDRWAVGASIQYPVMQYKHDVRVSIASPGSWMAEGEAGRGWLIDFDLSNLGYTNEHTTMAYEGTIEPGEERTYVVSVRWTDRPDEWVRTLKPYRDYFRAMYGPVTYRRSNEVITGYGMADTSLITANNPMGYRGYLRPDLNGFAPVVRDLRERMVNWAGVMLWAPTGVYNIRREWNWPYQAASHWESDPETNTAFDPEIGLPSFVATGKKLGIWWGRSTELALEWPPEALHKFDPDNPVHREAALRELDAAARAGATFIGLDTCVPNHTPIWKLVPWLRFMKERHPQITFVTEPAQCDILHTIAPTWLAASIELGGPAIPEGKRFSVNDPDTLAHFLLPGHETWVGFGYYLWEREHGQTTESLQHADVRRFAELGYRPQIFTDRHGPATFPQVAPSWEFLPSDVADSDPWIADLRAGRMAGEPVPQDPPSDDPSPPQETPAETPAPQDPPPEQPAPQAPPSEPPAPSDPAPAPPPSASPPPQNAPLMIRYPHHRLNQRIDRTIRRSSTIRPANRVTRVIVSNSQNQANNQGNQQNNQAPAQQQQNNAQPSTQNAPASPINTQRSRRDRSKTPGLVGEALRKNQ